VFDPVLSFNRFFLSFLIFIFLGFSVQAQENIIDLGANIVEPAEEKAAEPPTVDDWQGVFKIPVNPDTVLSGFSQIDQLSETALAYQAWQGGDYVKARVLAALAGADGDPQGQFLFAILLDNGLGGDKQTTNAIKWYREAANNGVGDAWVALAGIAFENRGGLSSSDGRKFLTKAARLEIPEAMLALGRSFTSGFGGQPDEVKAEQWFQRAIANGVNDARVALADLLLSQNKDDAALALYKTAVFGGSAEAAWKAGVLQADPDSLVFAPQNAGRQLQTAATAGNLLAMTAYGIFLSSSTPPLPASAARWFRKAAEGGEPEGQYLYALSLAKGEGISMDRELAYEWALRAKDAASDEEQYSQLAEALGMALPPAKRDLIYARAKMPLMIAIKPVPMPATE